MIGEAIGAAISKYGAIFGGLAIGTAAKYGLLLTDGKRLTLRGALADMLLLGMLGLLAVLISDAMHLTGNARVLCGALAAVSSDRLVRLARDRFMKSAEGQMSRLLPAGEREAIMRLPAGKGDPDQIDVQVPPTTPSDRMRSILRQSYGRNGDRPVPEDQIEQLRQLGRDSGGTPPA